MHSKSSEALIKICEYYVKTGKESFDSLESGVFYIDDSHLIELRKNRYIAFEDYIADKITILERGKNFARNNIA